MAQLVHGIARTGGYDSCTDSHQPLQPGARPRGADGFTDLRRYLSGLRQRPGQRLFGHA